jgi:hypothetical protein
MGCVVIVWDPNPCYTWVKPTTLNNGLCCVGITNVTKPPSHLSGRFSNLITAVLRKAEIQISYITIIVKTKTKKIKERTAQKPMVLSWRPWALWVYDNNWNWRGYFLSLQKDLRTIVTYIITGYLIFLVITVIYIYIHPLCGSIRVFQAAPPWLEIPEWIHRGGAAQFLIPAPTLVTTLHDKCVQKVLP